MNRRRTNLIMISAAVLIVYGCTSHDFDSMSPDELMEVADRYELGNEPDKALQIYQRLVGDDVEVRYMLAYSRMIDIYCDKGDYQNAELMLQEVATIKPRPDMMLKWVIVLYRLKEYSQAGAVCERIIHDFQDSEYSVHAKKMMPAINAARTDSDNVNSVEPGSSCCSGVEDHNKALADAEMLKNFSNLKSNARQNYLSDIEHDKDTYKIDRTALSQKLESLMRSKKTDNPTKCGVAYLIGLYRLDACTEVLRENFSLWNEEAGKPDANCLIDGEWPAQNALIQIGQQAVPGLIEMIKTSTNSIERSILAKTIFSASGAEGHGMLIKAFDDENDPQKKDRLEHVLRLRIFERSNLTPIAYGGADLKGNQRRLLINSELLRKLKTLTGDTLENYLWNIEEGKDTYRIDKAVLSQDLKSLLQSQETDNQTKCGVAFLIGVFKLDTCIDVLTENFLLLNEKSGVTDVRGLVGGEWPSQVALARMGRFAVPGLLRMVQSNENSDVRAAAVRTIVDAVGAERAKEAIEDAVSGGTDSVERSRLNEALGMRILAVDGGMPVGADPN